MTDKHVTVLFKKLTLVFQAMSSDPEAQNLKNNTVILMSHLGAPLVVSGFFCQSKGADRGNRDYKEKNRLTACKKPQNLQT